ncbi:DUF3168 domain-containing protein [Novosphingobium sp.]|uniref:tail completion protein gp17 n=1 Tax=Novosphingobium sp. TaxID=1874826 RepID=UPI0038B985A0
MEADLVARLDADAGVGALVGRDASDVATISWGLPVQGAPWPALVLTKISPGREYTHSGHDGLDGPRVQIDVLAETDVAADALAKAVIACMEAPATVGGTKFHSAFLDAEAWVDEGELDGGKALFRISLEFTFYHEEI